LIESVNTVGDDDDSPVQPLNAFIAIFETLDGMVIEVNPVQP